MDKKNEKNKGKKRPICVCGSEMIFVKFTGYYDERYFWICNNNKCYVGQDFEEDEIDRGCYA